VTIQHPFSLNKDVQGEIKKPATTTATFPPEPARAANTAVVPSQHGAILFAMQTSFYTSEVQDILTVELATGFLFGPCEGGISSHSP